MHSSFKINNTSFTSTSIIGFIDELMNEEDSYLNDIGFFLESWFSESSYIIVQTSGSTGAPKKIKLDKVQMTNSALATGEFFNLKENTKALLCLSANYIAGKMMIVRAIVLGWDIHLVAPLSNPLESVTQKFDFCAMVPLQVQSSLKCIENIKTLIIGGGEVSVSLQNSLAKLKTSCYATYGMTETITHIAVKQLNNFREDILNTNHYTLLPNIKISKDKRGCLVINAPNLSENKIITNDIVNIFSDSSFEWLGRFDNVVNSGGVKLFPEQIEFKLSKLIKQRFFIAGMPDEKLGQKLVLVIESRVRLIDDKLDYEKCKLEKYEKPKKVYFLNNFIETTTGKIKRNETLKLLQ
jgi:O-succinylbenzoic acid--CoA ligase